MSELVTRVRHAERALRAVLSFVVCAIVLVLRAQGQCQIQELRSQDIEAGDRFGFSAALDGGQLVLGAAFGDGPADDQGAVYVFDNAGPGWTQRAKIVSSDGSIGDRFGQAVALQGTRMIIGAPGDGDPGAGIPDHGSVYVFEGQGSSFTEIKKLQSANFGPNQYFGYSVSLDGSIALIGAPGDSAFAGGQAYVIAEVAPGVWDETPLVSSHSSVGDGFGHCVALAGDVAVIGAPRDYGWAGAVYVFERSGAIWQEVAALTRPPPVGPDWFGAAVATDGDRILVGSYYNTSNSREVHVFERAGNIWTQSATLTPSPPETVNQWGNYIALDRDRVLVWGWPRLQIFSYLQGNWNSTSAVELPDVQTEDQFSRLLAVHGDWIGLGSPGDDDVGTSGGSALVLSIPYHSTPYCEGIGCPCGNDDPLAGCANSGGSGARLVACGSSSVTADDLVLQSTSLPKNQSIVYFMGGGQVTIPFGDGLQCVGSGGSGIFRYSPPQNSGSAGMALLGPGIVARSQLFSPGGRIDAGETWNFQVWYRDPMDSPCNWRFNLSNAMSITFVP